MSKSPYFQVYKYGSKCGKCTHGCKNDPDKPCPFFEKSEIYTPDRVRDFIKAVKYRDFISIPYPSANNSNLTFEWMDTDTYTVAGTDSRWAL